MTRQAFESLTLPHLVTLKRLAMRYTRNDAAADDLVQEAYLRAWKYRARLDPAKNVKAWLCRILINEAMRERGRPAIQVLDKDLTDLDHVPDAARTIPEHVRDQALHAALQELPPGFAAALTLHVVEGLSYKEIASIQGVAMGTVMSRLHRARRLLRKALAPDADRTLKVVKTS